MNRFITASIAFATAVRTASCSRAPSMVYGFESLVPSTELKWSPCFDDFSCTRLQVPLDYANPGLGTTSIAFIKLPGKNATASSPSIVFIPGGPGGSGVDLLLGSRDLAGLAFAAQAWTASPATKTHGLPFSACTELAPPTFHPRPLRSSTTLPPSLETGATMPSPTTRRTGTM
ncbi:hypothetical protein NQ176_g11401 [Zarea fungicola]|uniref:Uncharacterized protein n=1 Tax=Zarea fungicola TaxID=93591 RepID=A0ACC1MBF8_9HYPO|nr:hypothetical protein NQ176_g11401 [Lecanicillium fungicola]